MSETASPGILPGILEQLIKVFEELWDPQQNEILFVTRNQEEGRHEVFALPSWELCLAEPTGTGSLVRAAQGLGQGVEWQKESPSNASS